LAEVETHHTASIAVEQLEVISAVMDNKWDMIYQEMIAEQEKPVGTLTVAELLANPVHNTEVGIYGKVSLLGELFCPCFELTSGEEKVLVWYGRSGRGVINSYRYNTAKIQAIFCNHNVNLALTRFRKKSFRSAWFQASNPT